MKKKTTVVSEKGQVTIPQALRRSLGLAPGTRLVFEEEGGRLVATLEPRTDGIEALIGIGIHARTDAFLDRTRGPRFDPRRDRRRR